MSIIATINFGKMIFEIIDKCLTVNSIASFIKGKLSQKDLINFEKKLQFQNIDECFKRNILDELEQELNNIKNGEYTIFSSDYQNELTNKIVADYDLQDYEQEIKKYINSFAEHVQKCIKKNVNDSETVLDVIISLNNHSEVLTKQQTNLIIETFRNEIQKFAEKDKADSDQYEKVDFGIQNIKYSCEIKDKMIQNSLSFGVTDTNYKLYLDIIFTSIESASGRLIFGSKASIWSSRYVQGQFDCSFQLAKDGIQKINDAGLVAFIKIHNRNQYYFRIFGNTEDMYYEQLSEKEYNEQLEGYSQKYYKAVDPSAGSKEWNAYHSSVLYTDFS